MKIKEQFERIERIDRLVRMKATGTPKKLAEKLNISESTLYELLNFMKSLGAPLLFDRERGSYCYEINVKFHLCFMEDTDKEGNINKNGGYRFSPLRFFGSGMIYI